jgi:hypothetical protein
MTQGALPTSGGYAGQASLQSGGDQLSNMDFLIRQIMAGSASSALVIVRAVHGGGIAKPPTVDVQPLVDQVDGLGNRVAHGVIYGMPCFRLQGGNGAVVLDPVVNDIGLAIICDRDISTVKTTGAQSGPGSARQNSWSDGCYLGGYLNAAPTNYVQFNSGGINVVTPGTISLTSPSQINLTAPVIGLNGNITQTAGGGSGAVTMIGPLTVVNDVTAVGTSVHNHKHGGVTTGGGQTGVPV